MITFLVYFNFTLALVSIVLTLGIVWHVQQKFDASFKFFLLAIIIFAAGACMNVLQNANVFVSTANAKRAMDTLFIICYTAGVIEMRILIGKLQESKKKK